MHPLLKITEEVLMIKKNLMIKTYIAQLSMAHDHFTIC